VTPSQSYTLPPLPEGTIVALKEVMVDPYPVQSARLGDGIRLVTTMTGAVEASVEAAGRMPSPESRSESDLVGDDESSGEPRSPKIEDILRLESILFSTRQATSQLNARPVAQNAVKSPKGTSAWQGQFQ